MVDVGDKQPKDGWNEWANKVLGDIERLDKKQGEIFEAISKLTIDVTILKTKAAMIGGIWGAVIATAISVISRFVVVK